ncbi:YfjI family protein [Salinibacter grassmerensis]|uniref:YfjI family protein n=1 Tax=Salinibacter grassmerensis TaxID=3040353 RepID=UPI0021E7E7B4|nr:YfjI family protein [Salinibacter grassmerensis]
MPTLLAEPASQLADRRKRDVFLTGALPMWAGALPNIQFRYGGSRVSPNLYSAVVAPPASGKSALRHARKYGRTLRKELRSGTAPRGSSIEKEPHTAEEPGARERHEGTPSRRNRSGSQPGRHLFLAADSSAAALKRRLEESPHGVIFETEFQSLSQALGSSWGSFTDVLLKGFQNETIKMSRSSKGTVTIPHPAPSIALAGTPAALGEVLSGDGAMPGGGDTPGAGNGLFSRFLFYRFDREFEWSSQFGKRSGSLGQRLQDASEAFRSAYRGLIAREEPLWIRVPEALQEVHTWAFRSLTEKWREDGNVPRPMQASLTRAGLQAVKIAVILRGVRLAETGVPSAQSVELGARDLEAGLRLSLTYLLHAIGVGSRDHGGDGLRGADLQEGTGLRATLDERRQDLTERQREYLEALPEGTFSTAEAKERAQSVGASERGVQRWLKAWKEAGLLRKPKRGTWAKRDPEPEGPAGAESVISVINGIPDLAD